MLKSVAVVLTDRCNAACSHCGSPSARGTGTEHNPQSLKSLFLQFSGMGVRDILLSGGEPLLHPALMDIVSDLEPTGMRCALLTNGTLLKEKHIRTLSRFTHISFVRLSAEYPERILRKREWQGRYHPTGKVFETLRMISGHGVTAGVNVTLFPDNLRFAGELARSAAADGAAFIRFSPVLPGGNAATMQLHAGFHEECLRTVLRIHGNCGKNRGGRSRTADASDMFMMSSTLCSSCRGGTDTVTIGADGRAHICPMFDLGGKSVNVYKEGIGESLKVLARRRNYLQRKLTGSNSGEACSGCPHAFTCRGGCLAEWMIRGRGGQQAVCRLQQWRKLSEQGFSADEQTAITQVEKLYREILSAGGSVSCVRAHPVWTVLLK
jgi:radical SAM protein with 4Fe4S-binding SPASM domain